MSTDRVADDQAQLIQRAQGIALLGLDVDGTLTDGRIIIAAEGELAKSFSVHDGQGIRLLLDAGITVAIITARNSAIVTRRAKELGINHVIQGSGDKATALSTLSKQLGLNADQVAFMGDDFPDLPAMRYAGIGACVADAAAEVRAQADWQSQRPGGYGAVREFAEFILKAQDRWQTAISRFTDIA